MIAGRSVVKCGLQLFENLATRARHFLGLRYCLSLSCEKIAMRLKLLVRDLSSRAANPRQRSQLPLSAEGSETNGAYVAEGSHRR
jgi:hypothetical protein